MKNEKVKKISYDKDKDKSIDIFDLAGLIMILLIGIYLAVTKITGPSQNFIMDAVQGVKELCYTLSLSVDNIIVSTMIDLCGPMIVLFFFCWTILLRNRNCFGSIEASWNDGKIKALIKTFFLNLWRG